MKKFIIFILSILLVFSLISCKQEPKKPESRSSVHEFEVVDFAYIGNPQAKSEVPIDDAEKSFFTVLAAMDALPRMGECILNTLVEFIEPTVVDSETSDASTEVSKAASIGFEFKLNDEEFDGDNDNEFKIDYLEAKVGFGAEKFTNVIEKFVGENYLDLIELLTADLELSTKAKLNYKNAEAGVPEYEKSGISAFIDIDVEEPLVIDDDEETEEVKASVKATVDLNLSMVCDSAEYASEKYPLMMKTTLPLIEINDEEVTQLINFDWKNAKTYDKVKAVFDILGFKDEDVIISFTWREKTGDKSFGLTVQGLLFFINLISESSGEPVQLD